MNHVSRIAITSLALSVSLWGQRGGAPKQADAKPLVLANDKLEFTISATGVRFNSTNW